MENSKNKTSKLPEARENPPDLALLALTREGLY